MAWYDNPKLMDQLRQAYPNAGIPAPQPGAAPPAGPPTFFGSPYGPGGTVTKGDKEAAFGQLERGLPWYLTNPWEMQRQQQQMLAGDPRYQQWTGAQADAYNQFQRGVGRMGREIGTQQGWMDQAAQRSDYAAQAARQNAMADIAKQGAMASRGGMSPAAIRQSMMMQSQVGAQMGAQLAAQRIAAQQEAQRAYLAARQQNLQNMQSGFGQATEGVGQALQAYGGASQIGSGERANYLNYFMNR